MRIFSVNTGIKGSRTAQEYAIRFAYMISEEAKQRAKIITFWKRYGLEATGEAYEVKRRTLYLWQRKLREGNGKIESLNCGSRAPKKKRQRRYDWRIVDEVKRLRDQYPNLGEKKLYPLLVAFCTPLHLQCPRPATIGRIIKDKGGMRIAPLKTTGKGKVLTYKRRKVLRKPHDLAAEHPGHVVALDTIERFVHGLRRYVITCEDIHSRFTFAWGTTSHASKAAEEFFEHWSAVFPYQTTFVLTDNGSEFKKHFADRLLELQITHYHTYPKTPKMNAHVERFNRTIQEEFIDYHNVLLLDLPRFNECLMDWLLFYNTRRVHHAFDNQLSPVQYLLQYEKLAAECKSTCGHTGPRAPFRFALQ
jgi:transposase InsO family protein